MNGYQQRTERKKDNIRQAALELFEQHGFDKVSVGDVAQKEGVSHVTIYKYFGSKDGLVSDIVKTRFIAQLQRLRDLVKSDKTFLEKLEIVLLDKAQMATPRYEELLGKAIATDTELRKFFDAALRDEVPAVYHAFLEEGVRAGFIDPAIPEETILLFLHLLRAGALADPQSWMKFQVDEKSLQHLQNLILYGLRGKIDQAYHRD